MYLSSILVEQQALFYYNENLSFKNVGEKNPTMFFVKQ